MRNLKTISLLLAVLLLIPACKAQDETTGQQHTESTSVMELTQPTAESTEPKTEATDLSTETTEPSESPTEEPTEPDDSTPEPQETVTVVGTYDSVEAAFADYPKRYVTYSNNQPVEDNYDVVCKEIQNDYTIEDQYIGFVFSDLEDMGFLVYVHNNYGSSIQIQLMQVYLYNTVYQVNGWVDLYGLYLLFGGNSIVVGDDVIAFVGNQNQLPILFYDGGYMCPKDDEQYSGQLFYFTEENGEIKYDWEKAEPNVYWGHSFEGWISVIINECKMNGDSIMRHSGTVVFEEGQLRLKEEQTYTLDDWFKICFYPERGNNDFKTTGWDILSRYGFNSIDELLNAYKTMSSEEWYQLIYEKFD